MPYSNDADHLYVDALTHDYAQETTDLSTVNQMARIYDRAVRNSYAIFPVLCGSVNVTVVFVVFCMQMHSAVN